MARVQVFRDSHLREIAKILAEAVTHAELSSLFEQCSIVEQGGTPRWERILMALSSRQTQDRCGNNVAAFIQAALDPARFTRRKEVHAGLCQQVSEVLSFSGLQIDDAGQIRPIRPASTLSEAEQRVSQLRSKLRDRNVHPDVLKFCNAELLEHDYFHAVFEATKSVADKIRDKSGLSSDGSKLVDEAFGFGKSQYPPLAFNSLQTDTEHSEHVGYMNLLKGLFGVFRNVTAHIPRIKWSINEQDALDMLTLASLLHRRLDEVVQTYVK
jgi:uncharacterized protein (TIGR02391 family)